MSSWFKNLSKDGQVGLVLTGMMIVGVPFIIVSIMAAKKILFG